MFITENEIFGIGGSLVVEADTNYSGAIGAQLLMAEGFENDFLMFGEAVKADAMESVLLKEGAGDEAVGALQEGALSNFYEKLKAWVKKIIAKLKGIFAGFIAKMQAWMGRDGRKFFDAHKKEIFGKDIDGLKFRYSKAKPRTLTDPGTINTDHGSDISENTTHDDLVEKYLGDLTGQTCKDKSSFAKDYHDMCFEDEDKTYDAKTTEVAQYVEFISGKEDIIVAAKRAVTNAEKGLNAYSKALDKRSTAVTKFIVADKGDESKSHNYAGIGMKFNATDDGKKAPGEEASTNGEAQKILHNNQKRLAAMNEAFSMHSSAFITAAKFAVSQSRRIAAAIIAYGGKKKNEETDLVELAQENAEYEFYSDVEA